MTAYAGCPRVRVAFIHQVSLYTECSCNGVLARLVHTALGIRTGPGNPRGYWYPNPCGSRSGSNLSDALVFMLGSAEDEVDDSGELPAVVISGYRSNLSAVLDALSSAAFFAFFIKA